MHIKTKLFGTVGKLKAGDSNLTIDEIRKKISSPLESDDGFMYKICRRCGCKYEITKGEAKERYHDLGMDLPEKIRGQYFELETCLTCSKTSGPSALKKL